MKKEYYEFGKAAVITVERCMGSLVVKGHAADSVAIRGEHEAAEDKDGLTIRAENSLDIRVPAAVTVRLQTVTGSLVLKGLEGDLEIDEVSGDVVVKQVQAAVVGSVRGDLAVRSMNGPLTVAEVEGDVALRDLHSAHVERVVGDLAVRRVNGDLKVAEAEGDIKVRRASGAVTVDTCRRDVNLRDINGLVTVGGAQGDIRLNGGLTEGKHNLRADGDIVIRWPASRPINVEATAKEIRSRLPLEALSESPGYLSGHIGNGETTLVLAAGGRIVLREMTADEEWAGSFQTFPRDFAGEMASLGEELAGIGEQIAGKVEAHMSELTARLEAQYGSEFAQNVAERAAHKTERAVNRAMRQAERARREVNAWAPPPPPAPARPKRKQASTEEQVKILNMLEKGTISVEEADTLLKALES